MSYYHYTKGCHLGTIVRDGFIKTSTTLLDKKEKPAVWLTTSPHWDVACNVGIVTNMNELEVGETYSGDEVDIVATNSEYMRKEIGMCRIIISEELPVITWAKFRYVSGISDQYYDTLDDHSRNVGSPVDKWRCRFKAIPAKYWEGIEMYVIDRWVRWDEQMPIDEFIDLCLECNGKKIEEALINGFPAKHCQAQVDFITKYKDEIAKVWEENKHKKGYIEIYIDKHYQPYPSGFRFVEKRIRKNTFKPLWESPENKYALVKFLWEATYTKYRMAVAC